MEILIFVQDPDFLVRSKLQVRRGKKAKYGNTCTCNETLGLSMELNDDILVQTTPPQTTMVLRALSELNVSCFKK